MRSFEEKISRYLANISEDAKDQILRSLLSSKENTQQLQKMVLEQVEEFDRLFNLEF